MKRYLRNQLNTIVSVVLVLSCMTIFMAKSHATTDDIALTNNEQMPQKEAAFPLPNKKPILASPNDKELLQQEAFFKKLNDINNSIKQQKEEIEEKLNLLKKSKTEQEKLSIQLEIDKLGQSIEEQEKSFEMIQTGGL